MNDQVIRLLIKINGLQAEMHSLTSEMLMQIIGDTGTTTPEQKKAKLAPIKIQNISTSKREEKEYAPEKESSIGKMLSLMENNYEEWVADDFLKLGLSRPFISANLNRLAKKGIIQRVSYGHYKWIPSTDK